MLVFGIEELTRGRPYRWFVTAVVPFTALIVMALLASRQVGHWKNSITVFGHAVEVTSDNYVAHNMLGIGYLQRGDAERGLAECLKAVAIAPDYDEAQLNTGYILHSMGRFSEAEERYRLALSLDPRLAMAWTNLGLVLIDKGKLDEAFSVLVKSVELFPDSWMIHNNFGVVLTKLGRNDEALASYAVALRLNPNCAEAFNNMGFTQAAMGRSRESMESYRKAEGLRDGRGR
jgi:Flp pilus assembly protein TadD